MVWFNKSEVNPSHGQPIRRTKARYLRILTVLPQVERRAARYKGKEQVPAPALCVFPHPTSCGLAQLLPLAHRDEGKPT